MSSSTPLFLLDVDNTLLNNDYVKQSIWESLVSVLGKEEAHHFWNHRQKIREEEGIVSFPKAVRAYCSETKEETCDFRLHMIFSNIDFKGALYDCVPGVIQQLRTIGHVAIFTEGDTLYQEMKVKNSTLAQYVDDVFIYEHKLEHISEIREEYPNHTFILVEDKPDNIDTFKAQEPHTRAIRVCQGHYADDHPAHEHADVVVDSIEELASFTKNHPLFAHLATGTDA
ncbi:MAG: HAD family hydrolase [Candidatus Paceibacteria bacterium]